MRRRPWIALLIIILIGGGFWVWQKNKQRIEIKEAEPTVFEGLGYMAVNSDRVEVSAIIQNLTAPSRLKITPDGDFLLVAQVTGEVLAFARTNNSWEQQPQSVVRVETAVKGFPPQEAGLTGLVFSSDYQNNHKLFLLYAFQEAAKKFQNRISVTTLSVTDGKLIGTDPTQIYQANVEGSEAHQIGDGIGVMVRDKPHLLVSIGEGFKPERAQNPKLESGKILLMQDDGSNPLGERPYPTNPKVQAIGVRNAYVLAANPFDKTNRMFIADTAPSKFDRLIYTDLFDSNGRANQPLNFGWAGSEDKLADPIPDPNNRSVTDMVIQRLPETRTFTGVVVHPGKGAVPKSDNQQQSVLVTLFGYTGFPQNQPGKEIQLGRLTNLTGQPSISFAPFIRRNPAAEGHIGNPIGLEIDSKTGDILFADIIEGRVYRAALKEEE